MNQGPKASLRDKIILSTLIVIFVLGFGIAWFVRMSLYENLTGGLKKKAASIGISLAVRSADLLEEKKVEELKELLYHERQLEPDFAYAFIADGQNRIIAHTFERAFPEGLLEANQVRLTQLYSTKLLKGVEAPIFDVAVPIIKDNRFVGTARAGISQKRLNGIILRTTWTLVELTILMMLVGILVSYQLARTVTKPILSLVDVAKVAGSGDFTTKIPVLSRDEVGELARAIDQMVQSLRGLIVKIKKASGDLTNESETIERVAENAKNKTEEVSRKILALGERSKVIGDITKLINELTERANLLALNASIEASKAGEEAKGFSFVAQEMKKLAERSIEATAEITRLLSEIQQETRSTIMAAEDEIQTVEEFVRAAYQLKRLAGELSESISQFKLS